MNVSNLIDQPGRTVAEAKASPKEETESSGLAPAPVLHLRTSSIHKDILPGLVGDLRPVPVPVVASLLGPEAAAFPMSEATFREALRLRTEQEKSRQEQMRLETAARNLAMMELAARSEVPAHLLPHMVAGEPADPRLVSPQQHIPPSVTMAQPYVYPQMSLYGPPGYSPVTRLYDHLDNASSVAPLNYRFGMSSNLPPETPRRNRSPAKIGAAAVANLTNPPTPYGQTYRTLSTHQRHFSMPIETGEMMAIKPNLERAKSKMALSARLKSPQRVVPDLQVKPLPAQPLNKQTKSNQSPSQESMTSFQHIIQFHHWKPQNPGDQPPPDKPSAVYSNVPLGQYSIEPISGQSRSSSRMGVSHKRHKSSDMSVDLLSLANTYYAPSLYGDGPTYPTSEVPEEDYSMETSDVSGGDLNPVPSSGQKKKKDRKPGRPRKRK